MTKRVTEHLFNGTTQKYSVGYDSTKTLLGRIINQFTGASATDKFAGPNPILVGRPNEASTAIPVTTPEVVEIENNKYWIFFGDLASAAATRRIVLYEYDEIANTLTWKGFITKTYPPNTAHTIRGVVVNRHLHTTGTVSCSATTAVTGVGTDFQTSRMAVGARIGFGSTNPANITTWYYISAITNDTSITLTGNGPTVSGVPYVIEELRVYTSTTNATAANGGLFVAKGINIDDFTIAGTTIVAATTTDNIKAVYWLADASVVLNIAATGLACDYSTISNTNCSLYIGNVDATTTLRIYEYNGRASLAGLASGKSTSAFVLRTGQQTVTGTISQANAITMATVNHGVASGVKSLYQTTTTRVVRIAKVNVVNGSTTYISDTMAEIPSGSVNTYAATGNYQNIIYCSWIDRFIINTGGTGRSYITQYSDGNEHDFVFGARSYQFDGTASSNLTYPCPELNGAMMFSICGPTLLINKVNTTSTIGTIYTVPLGADWNFAAGSGASTQNRLITPALSLPGCTSLSKVHVSSKKQYGSGTFSLPGEPFRVYYRTAGISDNSGSWNLVDETGTLPSVAASQIQFMFEFQVIGTFMIPARIYSVSCVYEDNTTDSRYQPSIAYSDRTNKRFAWRFATAFGGTVPTLYVRIYDSVSGSLLLTDDTDTPTGTWEKSTNDGSTWGSYNTSDKANETTYIRYTPNSLADNLKVNVILSTA